jgi:hypothetical protein
MSAIVVQLCATRAISRFACGAFFSLSLAGCGYSPVIVGDTLSYNVAVADSTNQMLLLNIVRTSQRKPTYYTRLEGNTETVGISSSNTLSLPLSHAKALNSPAAAGVYASKTVNISAITAALGLTPTDSSLLNLQTLDDQKYQYGMMSIVDNPTIQFFWNEGIQKDLLLLLFVGSADISRDHLEELQNHFKQCDLKDERGAYCKAYKEGMDNVKLVTLCGGHGPDDVVFINDPAIEGPVGANKAFCFRKLVQGLLAIHLDMSDAGDKPVEKDLSQRVIDEPKVRAEIIKEGLKVVENGGSYALCKSAGTSKFTINQDTLHERISAKKKPDPCQEKDDTEQADSVDLKALGLDLTIRSFEGIVYYLGENVRAEASGSGNLPQVLSRDGNYTADLFVALQDDDTTPSVLKVSEGGHSYAIPERCNGYRAIPRPGCDEENPAHDSMQVLSLVNQIWGLNKQSNTNPANPTVVVAAPTP